MARPSRRIVRVILAAAILAMGASGCLARSENEVGQSRTTLAVDHAAGFWRITARDGKACLVALRREGIGGALDLHVEKCAVPELSRLMNWRIQGDAVILADADGRTLVSFFREDIDLFISVNGRYRMTPAPMA